MTNVSDRPEDCYFMDSREQLKVLKEIRKLGLELIGIFHSHPRTAPYPSARDVELALYPEAVYLIVSGEEIRAFRIVEGKISPEEVNFV